MTTDHEAAASEGRGVVAAIKAWWSKPTEIELELQAARKAGADFAIEVLRLRKEVNFLTKERDEQAHGWKDSLDRETTSAQLAKSLEVELAVARNEVNTLKAKVQELEKYRMQVNTTLDAMLDLTKKIQKNLIILRASSITDDDIEDDDDDLDMDDDDDYDMDDDDDWDDDDEDENYCTECGNLIEDCEC